jgi:hypothetical protein
MKIPRTFGGSFCNKSEFIAVRSGNSWGKLFWRRVFPKPLSETFYRFFCVRRQAPDTEKVIEDTRESSGKILIQEGFPIILRIYGDNPDLSTNNRGDSLGK